MLGKFRRHFFVCQTERPTAGKPSCTGRGSREVLAALEAGLANHPETWGQVAVSGTTCLGPCYDGPNIVVYPEGTWYAGVTAADVPDIVEQHMIRGEPVSRLVYEWPDDD